MNETMHAVLRRTAAALLALALSAPAAAAARVVVVRTGDAPVIAEIADGFRSAFPGEAFEDVLASDAKAEAALGKRLEGATVVLSIGARAAVAVAKAKPSAATIAVVPSAQADPATMGPTMRLQPPADGLVASLAWMSSRFRRVGLVVEAGAVERQKIAEVEGAKRGLVITARAAKDARDVVTIVNELVSQTDAIVVDVSEGLQATDVQFLLRAAQQAKVPLLGTSEGFVKAGAPAAITIEPRNVGAEAGKLAKNGTHGMFDPRRFRLLVNLVAMERLGVEVPRDRGRTEGNILLLDTDVDEIGHAVRPVTTTKPAVAKQGRLKFPEIARRNQIRSGEVVLEILVKADGSLGEIEVLKGDAIFATAAMESIKTWQFRPGTRNGTPVDGPMRLNLRFQQ